MKFLRKRWKLIAAVAILIVLFLILRGRKKPVILQYATVSKNNISTQVSASGILNGKNSIPLHFNIAGKLNYLPFSNGDSILRGQLVAALDSTLANSAYQEALNTRRNTQAAVDNIHDQVKDHTGDETFAQKATRTAAETANDSAWDAVLSTQEALRETKIFSPISGIIVNQGNLVAGQNVTPTDLIAQIVDFSEKSFDATVDESEIGQIKLGQNAKVTLNAYGESEFSGKVSEIKPQTQTDTTGAITVTVKIKLETGKIANIYGLNGNANIIISSKENVITIPQDALIDDTHVYVKNQGKAEKREIQTGIKSDSDVEIISGLTEGDQVVTNPSVVKQ